MLAKLFNPILKWWGFSFSFRLPWNLVVIVMDGLNERDKAEIPATEAKAFIEKHSRFKVNIKYITTSIKHGYEPSYQEGHKVGVLSQKHIPAEFIQSLPAADSYVVVYALPVEDGVQINPAQAGSTWGVSMGLDIKGKKRPFATIEGRIWWYNLDPAGGFEHWCSQIFSHEVINTIQCVLEVAPYNCGPFNPEDHKTPYIFEGRRLACIKTACYDKLA